MKAFWAGAGRLLNRPLMIAILAASFSALFLPQITRQWQDNQSQRNLKETLLQQISASGTAAISHGLSLSDGELIAAGATQSAETPGNVYQSLRDTWFTARAEARSSVLVYFPALYTCWYSFDHAVSDYLSLGAGDRSASRITDLKQYVGSSFADSYVAPTTPDGCRPLAQLPAAVRNRFGQLQAISIWPALALPTTDVRSTAKFRDAYAVLAEELDIAMERVIYTIVKSNAQGFSHGVFGL